MVGLSPFFLLPHLALIRHCCILLCDEAPLHGVSYAGDIEADELKAPSSDGDRPADGGANGVGNTVLQQRHVDERHEKSTDMEGLAFDLLSRFCDLR